MAGRTTIHSAYGCTPQQVAPNRSIVRGRAAVKANIHTPVWLRPLKRRAVVLIEWSSSFRRAIVPESQFFDFRLSSLQKPVAMIAKGFPALINRNAFLKI